MKTQKQEEIVNTYLSQFEGDVLSLYRDIIIYLSELGYNPKKEGSKISFKHDRHNKQIAKMGAKTKKNGTFPIFSLRFSACSGYSQRFCDIIGSYAAKYPTRFARCTDGGCNFCAGEPFTHVYTYVSFDGETKVHCGAYAIEIPDITMNDINELKKLIKEEHDYLINHESS